MTSLEGESPPDSCSPLVMLACYGEEREAERSKRSPNTAVRTWPVEAPGGLDVTGVDIYWIENKVDRPHVIRASHLSKVDATSPFSFVALLAIYDSRDDSSGSGLHACLVTGGNQQSTCKELHRRWLELFQTSRHRAITD